MTVGVVGLGLIGGSVGLALRDPFRTILGYDPSAAHAQLAVERACVDRLATLQEVAQCDVVFVAVPPLHAVQTLETLRTLKPPDTILSDCTSVKTPVAVWAASVNEPNFVPGHPMAGHEKSGPGYASSWLFRGAQWIVSPLEFTSTSAVATIEELVVTMGAKPIRVSAERHDRHVAVVSHLTHAVAGILVQMADDLEDESIAGGSWRDLTRIAGVDPGLWTQIFMSNRVELAWALEKMSSRIVQLQAELQNEDALAVRQFFEAAKHAKEREAKSNSPLSANPQTKDRSKPVSKAGPKSQNRYKKA